MRSVISVAVVGLASGAGVCGPIDPPAGPVGPTMKTLQEIEPRVPVGPATTPGDADATPSLFKITQPGSYYLTGDIVVAGEVHAIEVASHNVTIDLNGFTIRGSNAAGRAGIIENQHQQRNMTIRNGAVRDFALAGVMFHDSDDWSRARVGRIERLNVTNCGIGIAAGGEYVISDCVISGGATGINGSGELVVERCHILNPTGIGINSLTNATTVRNCRIDDAGTHGMQLTQGVVERCEVLSPGQTGIKILSAGSVRECSVSNGGEIGIDAGAASVVENNRVYAYNDVGVRIGQRCRVVSNHIFYSFAVNPGSTQVGVDAVEGNCHIEGNTIVTGDIGVRGTGGGCFIARNVFTDVGTAWSLGGANMYGPLITATGQISTTNPWANFAN